jgi:hypothetical protein
MTWYHPKYYAALRAEKKKLQAASVKPEEPRPERPKVPSSKHQASSVKLQANIKNSG